MGKKLLSEAEFNVFSVGIKKYTNTFEYRIVNYIGKQFNMGFAVYISNYTQYLFYEGESNLVGIEVDIDADMCIVDVIAKCKKIADEFDNSIYLDVIDTYQNVMGYHIASIKLRIKDNKEIIDTLLRLKGI